MSNSSKPVSGRPQEASGLEVLVQSAQGILRKRDGGAVTIAQIYRPKNLMVPTSGGLKRHDEWMRQLTDAKPEGCNAVLWGTQYAGSEDSFDYVPVVYLKIEE